MTQKHYDESQFTFKAAFEADTDLKQYQHNALTVFALSLYLRLEDFQEFAANAITEGRNDKKVDICYVDENEKLAITAQSYNSSTWGKVAAPANKASDLNTATTWLLSASEELIPQHLKTKSKELRRLLKSGDIKRIEILFIHNCYESPNVEKELKAAAEATRDVVKTLTSNQDDSIIVSYREFGLNSIEELYKSRDSDILIDNWMEVPITDYVEEHGHDWKAILTTVPGHWMQNLHRLHGDRLFSANYRDYLGYIRRQDNINYQITQTAEAEPINFWVYNNGITALTHELQLTPNVRIRGISIINGAQTTGALGDSTESAAIATKVLIRIVECRSRDLINNIILYNNTQNEIKPADRRSNDSTQGRLRADFLQYGIKYVHRRSAIRTPRNAITGAAIAPALCAFHGDPQTAYRNAKEIFNDDTTYQRVFPSNIRAEHVFLVKALSTAIDSVKIEIKRKVSEQSATKLEEHQYEILKYSGAKHFLFYIIGAIAEEIMQRRVSDLYEWKCRPEIISAENVSMSTSWDIALRALLPQIATIVGRQKTQDPSYDVPRSTELSRRVAEDLKAVIASLETVLGSQFDEIRKRTTV